MGPFRELSAALLVCFVAAMVSFFFFTKQVMQRSNLDEFKMEQGLPSAFRHQA
jgi:hypothetical protein